MGQAQFNIQPTHTRKVVLLVKSTKILPARLVKTYHPELSSATLALPWQAPQLPAIKQ